jgi:hypothetical protein
MRIINKFRFLFLAIVLSLIINSCTKLPKETHDGKNTCGFLVDSKKFIASGSPASDIYSTYQRSTHWLTVLGDKAGTQDGIYISYSAFDLTLGKFNIDKPTKWATYTENGITFVANSGFLEITFIDSINKPNVLSGKFEFETENSDHVIRKITQGRFDLELTIYP